MKKNFTRKEVKQICSHCSGKGQVKTTTQLVARLGMLDIFNECPICSGEGYTSKTILVPNKIVPLVVKQ